MAGTVSDHRFADEAEAPINGDVIFVAKARDRNIDLRLAIRSGAGLSGQTYWDVLPALIASFSSCVLRCLGAATSVASTVCPPHRQIAIGAQPVVKGVKQHGDRLGVGQSFAEQPDCIGVGCRFAQIKAEKAKPA